LSIAGEESVMSDIKAVMANPAPIQAYTCRIRVFCLTTTWVAVLECMVLNSFMIKLLFSTFLEARSHPVSKIRWPVDRHPGEK
jgi:hypothetical protein